MGSHTMTLNLASTMILFLQLSLLVTFSGCSDRRLASGQARQMKNISENGFGPAQMKMMEGHMPMSPIMFKEGTDCSNCDNCKHCPKCWWCNFFGCGVNENCKYCYHCQNCEKGALCDQQCGNTDFHDGSANGYDCRKD